MAKDRRGGRRPGSGRKKGTPNRFTRDVKEALLLAAETIGLDGKGTGGLPGFFIRLGINNAASFASLLGKLIAAPITGKIEHGLDLNKLDENEVMMMERLVTKAQVPLLTDQSRVSTFDEEFMAKVEEMAVTAEGGVPPDPDGKSGTEGAGAESDG